MKEELTLLLNSFQSTFTEEELDEVWDFIQVNEYKLALETICAIFFEESKPITRKQLDSIKTVAQNMTIDPEKWERLEAQVS
ncbi:MafI family immunity protein [Pseudoalteromonas sp. CO348]|uniref:MafI family immunity protein n=1 Tax=unclassified Pseudoalteromonas TaxID=194690 RepID=UPI00102345AD|nr:MULTISPECIES: MafI family immunity protein [unclassified Pseudoalteromonas]MCG7539173.1 MafI family immunity protein [Pseudoalteromonas sp. OF7H-1]RZG00128.1 MafI family immunity protein [Pseudoalteromonas sp. CO348]